MTPIEGIVNSFNIEGQIADIQSFGSGHINDSFKAVTQENTSPNYLVQQINHKVFPDVSGLMDNIVNVTTYLKKELKKLLF